MENSLVRPSGKLAEYISGRGRTPSGRSPISKEKPADLANRSLRLLVAVSSRTKHVPTPPFGRNWPSKSVIFCKIGFNRAQMPDFSSGILSIDSLFSYTFPDRPSFLTSFGGGVLLVTFCLYEAWRDRHSRRTSEPSRLGKGTAFHPRYELRNSVYSHI